VANYGEAEIITRKAIELAQEGDLTAIRICLDRIMPPRRDRPVRSALPTLETASDAAAGVAAIVAAVARGEVTPSEAGDLSRLIDSYARTLLATDLETRVQNLEKINQR
jgi:hypothetical protein